MNMINDFVFKHRHTLLVLKFGYNSIFSPQSRVITHRHFVGPFFITDIVEPPDGSIGPAYRLVHCLSSKPHKALVAGYRIKPCQDREALIAKYKPEAAKPISCDPPPADLLPSFNVDNSVSAQADDQPPASALQQGFEPALRVERQRKRGQSIEYLILFTDRSRYWCPRENVSQSLLSNWAIKRDKRRHRNRNRK